MNSLTINLRVWIMMDRYIILQSGELRRTKSLSFFNKKF